MAVEELPSFRGNSSAMRPPEATTTLTQAISQLRKVLALERPRGLTTEYLVKLQNALEVADGAVRAERWAREGYEFQGE
jgi:DNA-binding SARP family transcriptional activator